MVDEKLLAKLYKMRELDGVKLQDYIDDFINDIEVDIAKDSNEHIGRGKNGETFAKWIKKAKKADSTRAGLLATHSKKEFVFKGDGFAILVSDDCGLPVKRGHEDEATQIASRIKRMRHECSDLYGAPTRAELDYQIKRHKALPKKSKPAVCEYEFGYGLPSFDSVKLYDILTVFKSDTVYLNHSRKEQSPMYLEWSVFKGVLDPVEAK